MIDAVHLSYPAGGVGPALRGAPIKTSLSKHRFLENGNLLRLHNYGVLRQSIRMGGLYLPLSLGSPISPSSLTL